MVPGGKREGAPEHRKRLSRFGFKSLWQHFGWATAPLLWQPTSEKITEEICNYYKQDGDLPTSVIRALQWLEQRRGCSGPPTGRAALPQGARGQILAVGPALRPISCRLQLWDVTFWQDAFLSAGFEACPRGCDQSTCTHVLQGGRWGSSLVLREPERAQDLCCLGSAQAQCSIRKGLRQTEGRTDIGSKRQR